MKKHYMPEDEVDGLMKYHTIPKNVIDDILIGGNHLACLLIPDGLAHPDINPEVLLGTKHYDVCVAYKSIMTLSQYLNNGMNDVI